jgi:cobalt/nickel transport system permease protein
MKVNIASNINTGINPVDGRVKTFILLAAIFIGVILKHWYLAAGQLLITLVLFIAMDLSLSKLLRRIVIPFGMAWFVFVDLLFTHGSSVLGMINLHFTVLPAYEEGLAEGLLMMLRILTATVTAALLSLSTPMPEILATLRIVKVPALIIDLAEMIYRYIFLMGETAAAARRAQLSRCSSERSWVGKIQDMGVLAGNVVVKSLERSIRIYKAMLSRGYDEDAVTPSYFSEKVPLRDVAIGVIGGISLIILILTDCLL